MKYQVFKCLMGQEDDHSKHIHCGGPVNSLGLAQSRRNYADRQLVRQKGDGKWYVGIKPTEGELVHLYDENGSYRGTNFLDYAMNMREKKDWTFTKEKK